LFPGLIDIDPTFKTPPDVITIEPFRLPLEPTEMAPVTVSWLPELKLSVVVLFVEEANAIDLATAVFMLTITVVLLAIVTSLAAVGIPAGLQFVPTLHDPLFAPTQVFV